MSDHEYIRVEEDDPNRCQGMAGAGQCKFKAMDGSQYCPMHGGVPAQLAQAKKDVRNLLITRYHSELKRLGDSDHIMSLRDEIGLLRMMMERILNNCRGDADLLIYSSQLADLTMKVSKVVTDCHKIEERTGNLLSREVLGAFALSVIELINEHVSDPDAKRLIADGIMAAMPGVPEQ